MTPSKVTRPFLYIALTLFLLPNVYAQKNYLPGSVITLEGDTLKGFINYLNWEENPDTIDYRPAKNSPTTQFTPAELESFQVKDEIYVSATVEIETKLYRYGIKELYPKLDFDTSTVFLQTIIQGPKSLFIHRGARDRENFYIYEKGKYHLLVFKHYLGSGVNEKYDMLDARFVQQLSYYLRDCRQLRFEIEQMTYTRQAFEKVFSNYYACIDADMSFYRKMEHTKFEPSILAGISISTLNFQGKSVPNRYTNLAKSDYSSSTNFSAGISVDMRLPRNLRKISLVGELLYAGYTIEGLRQFSINENTYTNNYSRFEYEYIKINFLYRYRYIFSRSALYFNGGIFYGRAINDENQEWIQEVVNGNETISPNSKPFQRGRRSEQGIILGTGYEFKKLAFEARYERGNGMSPIQNLFSPTNRFYFLLAYRL